VTQQHEIQSLLTNLLTDYCGYLVMFSPRGWRGTITRMLIAYMRVLILRKAKNKPMASVVDKEIERISSMIRYLRSNKHKKVL
jgi:hypothetical protein